MWVTPPTIAAPRAPPISPSLAWYTLKIPAERIGISLPPRRGPGGDLRRQRTGAHTAMTKKLPRLRKAKVERNTTETQILARLTLEGKGRYQVSTGIRFFDHML